MIKKTALVVLGAKIIFKESFLSIFQAFIDGEEQLGSENRGTP